MPITLPVTPYTPFGGAILNGVVEAVINRTVANTLAKPEIPIADNDVPAAAAKVTEAVVTAINNHPDVAVVPAQSPLTSKINWTAALSLLLTLLTWFGIPVDDPTKAAIITGINALSGVLIVVFKTYFTKSIATTSK